MTFFEAALEVLRSVMRPLHYKKITELAVNNGLLGHLGNAPSVTMGGRLLREIMRNDPESPLVLVEQGIFGLRAWSKEMLEVIEDSVQVFPDQGVLADASLPFSLRQSPDDEEILLKDEVLLLRHLEDSQEHVVDALSLEEDEEISSSTLWLEPSQSSEDLDHIRDELQSKQNEHYNVSAALVKLMREINRPISAAELAQILSQRTGSQIFPHNVILAMRADNALRVSRGKRAVFTNFGTDSWVLSENYLPRHTLRLESKIYDLSRQLKTTTLSALTKSVRSLSQHAWQQLASILLRQLNYTIVSQVKHLESGFILRADEGRGVNFSPALVMIIHASTVGVESIEDFRKLIIDLKLDHGVIFANGDFSRDALIECQSKEFPIYAYCAKSIAPIMFEAQIGVNLSDHKLCFLDSCFFDSLSQTEA